MSKQVKVSSLLDLMNRAGIRGIKKAEKTAHYTVLNTDSGTVFVANGSAIINFTTPAVSSSNKGHVWFFLCNNATGMRIKAGTTDTLVCKNDAAAKSVTYNTANEIIGAACAVYSDGTWQYFFELSPCTETITA